MRIRANIGTAALVAAVMLVPAVGTAAPSDAGDAPGGECRLPRDPGIGNESEGLTDYDRWDDPVGTVDAVMLFVDFPDAPSLPGELTSDYFGGPGALFEDAPGWVADASFGATALDIATPIDGWLRMPANQGDYGFPFDHDEHKAYVRAAVEVADAAGVDFSPYQVVYVVPTSNADAIAWSPALIIDPGFGIEVDGVELRHAATFGQDMFHWGHKVLVHETGHLWGLPDLYAYDPGGGSAHQFVGEWDIMGLISGHAPDLLTWHKWKLGWADDDRFACRMWDGTTSHRLAPVGSTDGTLAAVVRTGSDTAYVVENRQQLGLDAGACTAGALVYAVDASVWGGDGPVHVTDANPATSECGDPFGDAPFAVGTSFVDDGAGVRIDVTGMDGDDLLVDVTLTGYGQPVVGPAYDHAAGDGRITTAIEVARIHHAPGSAPPVLIARADNYADALTGAVLAHHVGGPVLLSPRTGLDSRGDVASFISELGATTAHVLGGEGALSPQVEADLRAAGITTIERIAGADRYTTARKVAEEVTGGTATTAYLTEGANVVATRGWPDALSVSGLAAWQGRPILLTLRDRLPEATASTIRDMGITEVVIVGGEGAVGPAVVDALDALNVSVERVSGPDRFATSVAIAKRAATAGMTSADVFVATGLAFPDALVAGPAVAAAGGTMVLVHGTNASGAPASMDWFRSVVGEVQRVWFLGGDAAVTPAVRDAVQDILG